MVESNAIPGFLPSVQGLHFANRWPHGPTVRFGPVDPRWVGIGDAANGLCGGMSWYVRDRYVSGRPVPADTEPPANGSSLFTTIVRLQVRSLELAAHAAPLLVDERARRRAGPPAAAGTWSSRGSGPTSTPDAWRWSASSARRAGTRST